MTPRADDPERAESPHPDAPAVFEWHPSAVVASMSVALTIMIGLLGLFLFGLIYALFGARPPDEVLTHNWPVAGALSALILVVHQLLHGMVAKMSGGHPRFDVDVIQWIFPVFYYRITGQLFTRARFLAIVLAPLLVISALGTLVMLVEHRGVVLIIPLAVNAGMSMRDLWMAWIAYREPPGAIVEVLDDGLRLIRPEESRSH